MKNPNLEHVVCNLCGADQPVIIYPSYREDTIGSKDNEFRSSGDEPLVDPLVKCAVCGFKYVTPRLNSKMVLEGYINSVDETFVSQAKGRELTFNSCLAEVQKVWGKEPGRILDVGTANGSFLKVAKDAGWQVAGCEPNRWMCDWCEKKYGIKVTQGTIVDGNYGKGSFDVITLWDVLEHTPDPAEILKECARILRHGGLLVVNYPDIGSLVSRIMGRKWVFLLSVHYFYFTRQTIRQALEQSGFGVIKMKPHFQSLELDYILFRATQYIGKLGSFLRYLVKGVGLKKVQVPYWVGQTLVVAKKGEDV